MVKLINISQLASLLNLVNSKTKKPLNYVLRYWEKEFNEIKPTILNKRRYYSEKQINILDVSKISSGMYMLQITYENKTINKRIIKK